MSLEPKVLRLFVALSLPDELRTALGGVQRELQEVLPATSAAWTKPDNFHLTLRFLGPVESGRLTELSSRLREQLFAFGELELICERLGCFPDVRFPRVVWTWVHDAGERLGLLHRRVADAVGIFAAKPAEERFVGHVTLVRVNPIQRPVAERLARFLEGAVARRFGAWRCRELELIRSELSAGGSRYTTLARFRL